MMDDTQQPEGSDTMQTATQEAPAGATVTHLPGTAPSGKVSLVQRFASRYHIDADKLLVTLRATAFRQSRGEQATDIQMAALLVVADQYKLNPFTREIFAFPDKQNGIVPVVSVDGWARIINEHPALNGIEFRYADDMEKIDADAKPSPSWCEVIIRRKDRAEPTVVREYLDEVYRPVGRYEDSGKPKASGPWQSHTKRMLRHKTLIQGARVAFGFAGIYDEDEAERIALAHAVEVNPRPATADAATTTTKPSKTSSIKDALKAKGASAVDAVPAAQEAAGDAPGAGTAEGAPEGASAPQEPAAARVGPTLAEVEALIAKAKNVAGVQDALAMANDLAPLLEESVAQALADKARARINELDSNKPAAKRGRK